MNPPQIIILVISCLVFFAAFLFYFKANNVAGTTTIIVALILCLVGGVGPSTIKDMKLKQSEDGFEASFSRNVDTPEKIQSVIEANIEIDKGITSANSKVLVQESMDVPDAKRSAADYLILATNSWKSGDLIDGIAFAQQGLRLDPKDVRLKSALLHRMGDLLSFMGNFDKAIEFYNVSISVDPRYSWPHNSLGIVLSELKRYKEAEDAYRQAIEIDPLQLSAYYNYGNMLRNLKRYDEAEGAYHKALEINPNYANAYYGLGVLLSDLKRYDEAVDAYRKAIEINPKYAKALYSLENLLNYLKTLQRSQRHTPQH